MNTRKRISSIVRRRKGFSIIDSVFALVLLVMGSLAFCSIMPVLSRSHRMSDDTSKAVQIANWEIEQIRQAGFQNANFNALYAFGLVDNWGEDGPIPFTTAPAAQSARFSPAALLREGTGELTIDDINPMVRKLTVVVKWKSPSGENRSVTLSSFVGQQ